MDNETEIYMQYEALIYKVAKAFYGVELADLFQAGSVGLIKAIRNYKPENGTSFKNYAYMHIFGEMYELVNKSRDIKLSKAYLQLYKNIQIARSELINTLYREPTIEELAAFTKYDEGLIAEVITLTTQMLSLDNEKQNLDGDGIAIIDTIGETPDYDSKILIEDSLQILEPIEQDVIKIRYFEDLTQMETAEKLGISQVKVSRIENRGKQKIKEYIAA